MVEIIEVVDEVGQIVFWTKLKDLEEVLTEALVQFGLPRPHVCAHR
jgi:hypothetical protein